MINIFKKTISIEQKMPLISMIANSFFSYCHYLILTVPQDNLGSAWCTLLAIHDQPISFPNIQELYYLIIKQTTRTIHLMKQTTKTRNVGQRIACNKKWNYPNSRIATILRHEQNIIYFRLVNKIPTIGR